MQTRTVECGGCGKEHDFHTPDMVICSCGARVESGAMRLDADTPLPKSSQEILARWAHRELSDD